MKILIVGGGIGGLALALALKQRGLHARIVERAKEIRPVGAGITIQTNATTVLERLGLAALRHKAGQTLGTALLTDAQGKALTRVAHADNQQAKSIALHRADLLEILYQPVRDWVGFGRSIQNLEQHKNTVSVTFNDGSEDSFDLLVGCNGIRSTTRRLAFGQIEPRYAGYSSWRFVLSSKLHLPNPIEMWGNGVRLGLVSIGKGRIYGFTTFNCPKDVTDSPVNRLSRFKQLFGGFGGSAPEILGEVTQALPPEGGSFAKRQKSQLRLKPFHSLHTQSQVTTLKFPSSSTA
jgi:2-polyprenyl-6-methoxyphenol hydroxylase-like FAD-dependent oxidoreductase